MIKYFKVVSSNNYIRYYASYSIVTATTYSRYEFGSIKIQEVQRSDIPDAFSIHSAGLSLADTRLFCRFAHE